MKPKIIVTRKLPEFVEAKLKENFLVSLNNQDLSFDRQKLIKAMESADGLLCTVSDKISREILEASNRKVRIIANFGVGVDNIDLESARKNNIIVSNTPDVLTEATVDIATLLLLSVTRKAYYSEMMLRLGKWKGFSLVDNLGVSLRGKTLGIIGMGRSGRSFAKRANKVFGMKVLYFNRSPVKNLEFDASVRFDLNKLLEESNVISLHISSGKDNQNFLSKNRLGKIRKSSFLINTSRGDVIDQEALTVLLEKGKIAGAGLDVFSNEPNVPENLRCLANVTLLPHIGSATVETREMMGMVALDNLLAFFNNEEIPNRVV